jgi:NAD(P)-dependent dehydrogenase (short-subunit alcohol dehydrogenase family)
VTALITGGSSGIGLGLAKVLGQRGARIAIASSNGPRINAAVTSLLAEGIEAIGVELDVADAQQWSRAVTTVEERAWSHPVAGVECRRGPAADNHCHRHTRYWQWALGVNLWGVIHGLRTCLPRMLATGKPGHILITSSIAALNPRATMGVYVAAKAGIAGLAKVLRAELSGGPIGVSVLTPAAVRTDIVARSRVHSPAGNDSGYDEIAAMLSKGLDPVRVAEYSLERIQAGAFYILTHDKFRADIARDAAELMAAMDTHA